MIAHPAQPVTLEQFTAKLAKLTASFDERHPGVTDYALRLSIAETLYLAHDALRSQERPFDRDAFASRLDAALAFMDLADENLLDVWHTSQRPAPEVSLADLYSRCWAKYSDEEFKRTIEMFGKRLALNGVTLNLHGKDALDAGSGSGRYTFALADCGANHADGFDLSDRAVAEAEARRDRLGYRDRVSFWRWSIFDMPPELSDRFDFVCSNGVVHHTPDPVKGLQEIYRVLKPGGQAFLMVYGKGGLFWALTDFCRELLSTVPVDVADAWLTMRNVPVGKVFFCLDHWYTPYQERVTREEFEQRLTSIGFTDLHYLPRGYVYDASERYERYPEERDLIGSPDMRYLVRKP